MKSGFPWWSKALILVLIGILVIAAGITGYLIIKAKQSGKPSVAFLSQIVQTHLQHQALLSH